MLYFKEDCDLNWAGKRSLVITRECYHLPLCPKEFVPSIIIVQIKEKEKNKVKKKLYIKGRVISGCISNKECKL